MKTLLMIKPDIVDQGKYGDVIAFVLRNRFKPTALKMLSFTEEMASRFYEVHKERPFFADLVSYITSGPVVAMEIDGGDDIISQIRAFIGTTDPAEAAPGTVRYQYGANIQNNAVHASDSAESAKKELAIVFSGS